MNISALCRLGLYREAEKQFRSALNHQEVVDTYLYLAKVLIDTIAILYINELSCCTVKEALSKARLFSLN